MHNIALFLLLLGSNPHQAFQILAGILGGTASTATYPSISYDQWNDFEQCTNAAAPTPTCLNNSDHVATGSWSVSNTHSSLTIQSAMQSTETRSSGTHGFQYSAANPSVDTDTIDYTFAASHSQVSLGFWYNSVTCSATNGDRFVECIHTVIFQNSGTGDLCRISDENDPVNGVRELRISPCNSGTSACEVSIADNTKYWISFQYTASTNCKLNVYTPTYSLVGTALWDGTQVGGGSFGFTANVTDLFLGTDLAGATNTMTLGVDNVIMIWSSNTFPVLP